MLSENLDKKIKEAAEQHHPAYDEKAWLKMEHLLNEHLPRQKDDKRRIFLLLLTFILVGGGAFLLLTRHTHNNVDSELVTKNSKDKVAAVSPVQGAETNGTQPPGEKSEVTKAQDQHTLTIPIRSIPGSPDKTLVASGTSVRFAGNKPPQKDQLATTNANIPGAYVNDPDNKTTSKDINRPAGVPSNIQSQPLNQAKVGTVEEEQEKTATIQKSDALQKANEQQTATPETQKPAQKKNKLKSANGLSFFVAAGPDASKAGTSKTGKLTLAYGAGVAYKMNRFTIKTGVFESKKIYWAGSDDYKLTYVPPPNVKFQGADANCTVMEIPLKLSYDFGFGNYSVKNKGNWFAGAGVSSYLMKSEKYVYVYKSPTATIRYPYETKNENHHYFSVLNFSAGYSRHLNNTFTISAEPYLEMPLTGVGAGKVYLNSAGVLFTIGVTPFRK